MGKSIIVKGADFSAVAIAKGNLFNPSQARRNYAVYALNDSADSTTKSYDGFCCTPYISIPSGAVKIRITAWMKSSCRYRFTKAASDSEAVPQGTGLAGVWGISSSGGWVTATLNVPSDPTYIYFSASIYRAPNMTATEANNADLSGVVVEAIF